MTEGAANPSRALDARVRAVRGRHFVARGEDVYELNEVAGVIWRLCDGSRSVDEVAVAICDEYDVDPEVARADTRRVVDELRQLGFVT